jgi:sigma-B regulation protein RsbU (phosphoserine phosphatase)
MSSGDALRRIAGEIDHRRTITRSLSLARRRQRMMLPLDLPEIPDVTLGMVYRPAEEISGDFYDIITLADDRVGILLGDVSGHGIEAALVMGMAKKALQIFARGRTDPAEVLAVANDDLCPDLDNETFLTGIYAILSPEERMLRLARAGHPHPSLCNPVRQPPVVLMKSGGMILGMDEIGEAFRAATKALDLHLKRGDVIVLYTDGVDECRSPDGDEFGVDRIMDAVESLADRDAQSIAEGIEKTVVTHAQAKNLKDDVTILVLKVG